MPILRVGRREIAYSIRRSSRAHRRSIVITPGAVEVVAPESHTDEEIAAFVHTRRRWVHDETERMEERLLLDRAAPSRYVSGAKVLYRGRRIPLTVQDAALAEAVVEHRGGFLVRIPQGLTPADREHQVEQALLAWLHERARQDVGHFVRRHSVALGVTPTGVRIKQQKHLWGSCGRDGTININWQLIFAPRAVLEYAVAHELCHLRERSHGPEFWQLVRRLMPDYEARKQWLERNELECRWL